MFARWMALGLVAAAAAAAAPDWYWYYYTLDSTGNARGYSKLRYDEDGKLKIAYRSGYDVKYGIFDEEASTFRVLHADTGLGFEAKIDMALDEDGNPHIIHHDYMYQRLMYAHYDGDEWIRFDADTLKHPTTDHYQISIAIDDEGVKHMLYTTSYNNFNNVTYSSLDKDLKRIDKQVFTEYGSGGKWNSLAFDPSGGLVAAYFVYIDNALVIGTRDGDGKWTRKPIPKNPDYPHEGFYATIKRSGEKYFIVAHERSLKHIRLLTGKPGDSAWAIEKIDTLRGYTQFSTQTPMIVGKDGEPIVVIPRVKPKDELNAEESDLYVARRKDSEWQFEAVDTAGIVGVYADMTATPEGLPAITYFEVNSKQLRLAIARTTEPKDENENGIPDYREKPVSILRSPKSSRPPRGTAVFRYFDVLGRVQYRARTAQGPVLLGAPRDAGRSRP